MKVIAALSGGVDSAVAAALLVEAGHEVTAVHLALASGAAKSAASSCDIAQRGCCTPEDARDARRVADVLGIPFYVWDFADRFQAEVIDDFLGEYAAGRTPNPCLRCNERIKFAGMLDRALALGFDAIATGHYARLDDAGPTGGHRLRRAADPNKDQSYVLAGLTRAQLDRLLFPLGGLTKPQVRQEAARRGITVADKPDSTDICFIPDGDPQGFLSQRLGAIPGPIIDAATGQVLGQHQGTYRYTVGQRRGLNLRVSAPDRQPRYVLSVAAETNTVLVGPLESLDITLIRANRAVWTGAEPTARDCQIQFRAHGETIPAQIVPTPDGELTIRLLAPARGVAAGQAVVAYQRDPAGDIVLCSATITAATNHGY